MCCDGAEMTHLLIGCLGVFEAITELHNWKLCKLRVQFCVKIWTFDDCVVSWAVLEKAGTKRDREWM